MKEKLRWRWTPVYNGGSDNGRVIVRDERGGKRGEEVQDDWTRL